MSMSAEGRANVVASNKRRAKHGMYKSRAYQVWDAIKSRCLNPNNNHYHRYGGRGITLCKRWQKFENFLEDMGEPPKGMTIDRKNNNRGYMPSNCRWATPQQQANNRYTNTYITYKGKTQTIAEWSRETGVRYSRLVYRMKIGWEPPKLFSKKTYSGISSKYDLLYEGRKVSVRKYAELTGIPLSSVYVKIYRGEV